MTNDLDALLTALYVEIDDHVAPSRRGRGRRPELTDAELICLAVAQVLLGFDSEHRWIRFAYCRLGHLFPYLPGQPGYHKRLRAVAPLLAQAISHLARSSLSWCDSLRLLDATPVWVSMAESARPAAAGAGGGPDVAAVYPLGSSAGESARLRRQADELAPDSMALLDRVGLAPGHSAIDLGCGPRGILDLLAGRVSPGGRVVGLDADPAHTAMAAKFASDCGLSGVEIVTADARHTGLAAGSFDLVHARTLLINLPDPAEAVTEMVRLARPGGAVAVAEPDTEHALCYPPHPAFDRAGEIFRVVFGRTGADPALGRRVPELFRQAGLTDVGVESRTQMYPPGHSRRTVRLDLVRAMRPQIAEIGLASEDELDQLDAALRPHLEDPRTVVMTGLLFLVWGRKPA